MRRLRHWIRDHRGGGTRVAEGVAESARLPSPVVSAPTPVPSPPTATASDAGPSDLRRHETQFRYKPLPLSSDLRILHLKRRPEDARVPFDSLALEGSLVEASIDATPEYYALSYTWGDPAPCESINIDGQRLGITANCASALRRMLRGKVDRLIWVDSICINQANTPEALEERSGQVAMMDQIYRNALRVEVYLGPGDAASDVACEALKSLAQYYLGAKVPGPMQGHFRKKYEKLADEVLATSLEYPYGKLHGVFRLPWFRRTWVVQEVVLGRNVMFYCGTKMMHLKTVVIGADFTRLPYSKLDVTSNHWKSYMDYQDYMQEFVRRKEEGEPLSNFGLGLSAVIRPPALFLEATRPEDKIYGLYGICKRLGMELPVPDYSKPLATVYTETAQALLREDTGLELLSWVCESAGWEQGIPSWVPNFSGTMRAWSPSNPPHMVICGRYESNVSGLTKREFEYKLDGQALSVKGRRLDAITAVGRPWETDASTNLLGGSQMQTGQYISSLLSCVGSWLDVVKDPQDSRAAAVSVLGRVLVQDVSQPLTPEELNSFVQHLAVLVDKSGFSGHLASMVLAAPQDTMVGSMVVGEFLVSQGMLATLGRMVALPWKTVFRTTNGYLGVGTHTARSGDILAVFRGCSTVAILRPWGDWFRYIGPAYVDQIMDGSFWGRGTDSDDEWFTMV
ncbi:heterokaryon incompatibility protein-domain-containing protein [Cercophora newfieldiana]|uniref:Heterokaryon incompatibility protein-domain-containing protein n=1 Tax=Cercophora newfieldiana TaxID=92897 RepID=A0AA39YCD2_9PEZI|nr:heterokaryon incompatibility protein-domain-containing protein [Cercophora newfieldiana]